MSPPNVNALWGRAIVDELVGAGLSAACIAPGSRSTPIVVALAEHDDVEVYTHLDERCAAFFAVGRAKVTGDPTPVVSTSGTATAEFHPAVLEADRARVPMLVVTADRPPELHDSGANQTVDQHGLYGEAVRWHRSLPEPGAQPRRLRSLRTAVGRAVAEATGLRPGPVHLNVPFSKPLEPRPVPGDVPDGFAHEHPRAATGRGGAYVRTHRGPTTLTDASVDELAGLVEEADRGLIVAGPADPPRAATSAIAELARASGFPVLADPLSGLRFGPHVGSVPVCGGYDAYLDPVVTDGLADPDVVIRFGDSPTSKRLRDYLAGTDARGVVVDPGCGWREATFVTSDLVCADPAWLARRLAAEIDAGGTAAEPFGDLESRYWDLLEAEAGAFFEGGVVRSAVDAAPDGATVLVSNSMPVRDLDRFGRPAARELTVLGNRGASGIDGITSTALGAGSAAGGPLVLLTGDLAFYHDMNGLLGVERFGVDVTVVCLNNDGGGIFHRLPIADYDPPFTEHFRTPHGLDFEPAAELYGLDYRRVESAEGFDGAYGAALGSGGSCLVDVRIDAVDSHDRRDRLDERVRQALATPGG